MKKENTKKEKQPAPVSKKKYDCPVCNMDEWCGTDGCPMDPQ